MVRRVITFLHLLLIPAALSPALVQAQSSSSIHRAAESPPPHKIFQEKDYADEIDKEIARYFNSLGGVYPGKFSFANSSASSRRRAPINYTEGVIKSHRVQSGDSIWSISRKYGVSTDLIIRQNPALKKRPIYIGEEILIDAVKRASPRTVGVNRYYRVKKGDSLWGIARRYKVSVKNLRRWNGIRGSMIKLNQRLVVARARKSVVPRGFQLRPLFIKPVEGRITSGYGRRRNPFVSVYKSFHKGIDYGASLGTPFYAARSGVVISARRMGGYGNCIFIRHAGGYVSVYAHSKKMMVRTGDVVKQGQRIGLVGRTGNATGPHLHFEIRQGPRALNPLAAFKMKELITRKAHLTLRMSARAN